MNDSRHPLNADTPPALPLLAASPSPLELGPAGLASQQQDSLNAPTPFATLPFDEVSRDRPLHVLAEEPLPDIDPAYEIQQKKLQALRNSPVAQLVVDSPVYLQTYLLDLDWPPRVRDYVRGQLSHWLQKETGKQLSPDALFMQFKTQTEPAVERDGRERYKLRLSLTDLALTVFDPARFLALVHSAERHTPLDDAIPELTGAKVIELIDKARWADEYLALLKAFWSRHQLTYAVLAKLSFLDGLARQLARHTLSRDGYDLALDALGLRAFPGSAQELEQAVARTRAEIRGVTLDGQLVPGVFQLRSTVTSHCFIHILGEQPSTLEYISDDPQTMTRKLAAVMIDIPWLGPYLDVAQANATGAVNFGSRLIDGDVFFALAAAQKAFSLEWLQADIDLDVTPDLQDDAVLLKPIERALAIVSAVDVWQVQSSVLEHLPNPLKSAARIMGEVLKDHHGLEVDPEQVFIRYLPGTSRSPWGNVRQAASDVHVPDEKPISLSEALVSNYRVERPVGYSDEGGRSVVYTDATSKGEWQAQAELPVSAEAIEQHIASIDFLAVITRQINEFWTLHHSAIEQSFKRQFQAQAVICLKQGSLTRDGFAKVMQAIEQMARNPEARGAQWRAVGFYVHGSLFEGMQQQSCAGLLIIGDPSNPQSRILYQAGRPKAFVELHSDEDFSRHIQKAAADEQWRMGLLNYVPTRHHSRLNYLLKLWAGEQGPYPPVSVFRPWTDVIYNPDVRKAQARELCEQVLSESPFTYMHRTLKQNGLEDAQEQIVTTRELSLRYWTQWLNHLQLLLAPMTFLLTPAAVVALAVELGILSLNIASANLPGSRYAEKKQAILSALCLGLLRLGPYTPRLLKAFGRLGTSIRTSLRTVDAAVSRSKSVGSWLNRSISPRQTRVKPFFNTGSLLKSWTIPGHPSFGSLPVKVWKLERKFLLWTSQARQARTLVVSTHGYSLPWAKATAIPNGTELRTYAPDGFFLLDPRLHRVVSRKVKAFAIHTNVDNRLATTPNLPQSYVMTEKLLAGTARPGMIKNYSLAKFQNPRGETYQGISQIVRNSHQSPFNGQLMSSPMDVLTVRSRFGMRHPTLEDLFDALWKQGIHYDKILLVHCRCSAFSGLFGTAPIYAP